MELIDVVRKLVGPVLPVGETNADADRYGNLQTLTKLTAALLDDLDAVAANKSRHEFSMKRAGEWASRFLTSLS